MSLSSVNRLQEHSEAGHALPLVDACTIDLPSTLEMLGVGTSLGIPYCRHGKVTGCVTKQGDFIKECNNAIREAIREASSKMRRSVKALISLSTPIGAEAAGEGQAQEKLAEGDQVDMEGLAEGLGAARLKDFVATEELKNIMAYVLRVTSTQFQSILMEASSRPMPPLERFFWLGMSPRYLLGRSPCSEDGGSEGAKERLITRLLKHLCDKWEIKMVTTLSTWAASTLLLARLTCCQNSPYDVNEARKEFTFIGKADIVPDAQTENPEAVFHFLRLYQKYPVAETTIPYLKIRLVIGRLGGQAPARTGPTISVKLNGTLRSITQEHYSRLAQRSNSWSAGMSKPFQTYFKKGLKKLEKRRIGTHEYTVNVQDWKRNCGQHTFSPFSTEDNPNASSDAPLGDEENPIEFPSSSCPGSDVELDEVGTALSREIG
ncbi:hypothetical protein BKA70DRAFT_1242075 [Coprinopsis sp. MPI-PUGE-AT-0042]|nr:hypothetical protein BKA70DRAFT_1242075 [Coprinopsis sp. MPI-PUGE-AT-0042]